MDEKKCDFRNIFDENGNIDRKAATEMMKNTPKSEQPALWQTLIDLSNLKKTAKPQKNKEEEIVKEKVSITSANPRCFDTSTFSMANKLEDMTRERYIDEYVAKLVDGCHEIDEFLKK